MKRAGAFVVIDSDGQLSVERGLIRREDAKKLAGGANAVAGAAVGVAAPKKAKPLHGEKACLMPHRASHGGDSGGTGTPAQCSARGADEQDDSGRVRGRLCAGIRRVRNPHRGAYVARPASDLSPTTWPTASRGRRSKASAGSGRVVLLERTAELLLWLLAQEPDLTSNLFAFCVAATLDGTSDADRAHPINELADLLNVDLSYYWKPTRASYFDHVSKARIVDVVAAAVSPEAAADLQGMKKSDAAAAAELRMVEPVAGCPRC